MKSTIAILFISCLFAAAYAAPRSARFQQVDDSFKVKKLMELLNRADAQIYNDIVEQQQSDYETEQQDNLVAAIESLPEEAQAQFFHLIGDLLHKFRG